MSEIELSSLDLRYEGYRMRNRAGEARLLASICERGIVESLEGVEVEDSHVLLNGFKRWRCARRLGLATAPYVSLGEDAAMGSWRCCAPPTTVRCRSWSRPVSWTNSSGCTG